MKQSPNFAAVLAAASEALSGETNITEGEEAGWLLIGGTTFGQPVYIKDETGAPLIRVVIEATPRMPAEYLNRVLPVLIKRDEEGGLLRMSVRFDDDSMSYSNQPTEAIRRFFKLA